MIGETRPLETGSAIPTPPIVYVVDDDPSFLRSVARRLRTAGFGVETFDSAADFLARRRPCTSGCAVLDLQMPGLDGLKLQEALTLSGEPLVVIFLSGHGDIPASVRAMRQGAADFLTKPVKGAALIDAVNRALALAATARDSRRETGVWRTRYKRLTTRERQVFALVVNGLHNKQMAGELGVVERTIKAHRAQVMAKMEVGSVAELTQAAIRLGGVIRRA